MITQVIIRQENQQAHYDIQKDLMDQKNGVFTFILKVHQGLIKDYVRMQAKRFTEINES
jgi:hypothetical protein